MGSARISNPNSSPVYSKELDHLRPNHPSDSLALFLTRCPLLPFGAFFYEFPRYLSVKFGQLFIEHQHVHFSQHYIEQIVNKCEHQILSYFDYFLQHDTNALFLMPEQRVYEDAGEYQKKLRAWNESAHLTLHMGFLGHHPYAHDLRTPEEVIQQVLEFSDSSMSAQFLPYANNSDSSIVVIYSNTVQWLCWFMIHSLGYARRTDLIRVFVEKCVSSNRNYQNLFPLFQSELVSTLLSYSLINQDMDLFQYISSSWDALATLEPWTVRSLLPILIATNQISMLHEYLASHTLDESISEVLLSTCFMLKKLDLLLELGRHHSISFSFVPFLYYYRDTEDEREALLLHNYILEMMRNSSGSDQREIKVSGDTIHFFVSILLLKQNFGNLSRFISLATPKFLDTISHSYLEKAIPSCSLFSLDYLLRNLYHVHVINGAYDIPPEDSTDIQKFYYYLEGDDEMINYDPTLSQSQIEFFAHYHERVNPLIPEPNYCDLQPLPPISSDLKIRQLGSEIPFLKTKQNESIAALYTYCLTIQQMNVVTYYFGRFYQKNMRRLIQILFNTVAKRRPNPAYRDHFSGYSRISDTKRTEYKPGPTISLLIEYFKGYLNDDTKRDILVDVALSSQSALKELLCSPLFESMVIRKAAAWSMLHHLLSHPRNTRRHSWDEALIQLLDHPHFSIEEFDSSITTVHVEIDSLVTKALETSKSIATTRERPHMEISDYEKRYLYYLRTYSGDSLFVKVLIYYRLGNALHHFCKDIPKYESE